MIPLGVLASANVPASGGGGTETSIWGASAPGGNPDASGNYNLGTVITCNNAGQITALRYYEALSGAGTVTLRLYIDGSSTAVREVTHTATSGVQQWNTVSITPYTVTAGQRVMVAYSAPLTINKYWSQSGTFASASLSSADSALTAPQNGSASFNSVSTNGRYSSSRTTMPTLSFNSSGYAADLVLTY